MASNDTDSTIDSTAKTPHARVLSLDFEPLFGGDGATLTTFKSDTSVFDYDVVIWDPERTMQTYSSYDSYQGLPSFGDSESARLKADVSRRRTEFVEYINSGRPLIVIARPPQTVYVATGEVRTSGTGRNAARTRVVTPLDILSAIPQGQATFAKAGGSRIKIVGSGPIQDHLHANAKYLQYAATLSDAPGTATAVVSGTERVVASVFRNEAGGILAFMPDTNFEMDWEEDGETELWPDEAAEYQSSLINAVISQDGAGESSRPAWAANFATQRQLDVRATVAKQEASIERARKKLVGLQAESSAADLRDQLYLGSGRALELQVKEVLELLDGEVFEPEQNRDDWRVDFGDARAVVEVKGVSKSAAEKHAAQLEKWAAGAFAETEVTHKGILVVNTWRELPLDERTDVDFPAQMIPYSTGRDHVLVTGLELFIIANEIENDPTRATYWRDKILSTAGRLTDVPDWRDVIQETEAGEAA